MKKATLFTITLLYLSIIGYSQSQKMILVEHFTQASCGPCATYNPILKGILDDTQNANRITSIKYQTSWPGFDPMHDHNPSEVDARVANYGVSSVPNTVIGGNFWIGNPAGLTQSIIDSAKNDTSLFDITLSHDFNDNMDEIEVTMKIKANATISANLIARIAVVEREINFSSPPGSNGERDFHNVMKKMLPNNGGTALPNTMNPGDSVIISESWKMKNVYDNNELAVVAFVQTGNSSTVHQASYSAPIPFVAKHNLNLQVTNLESIPNETCSETISPSIDFRNAGSTPVTSASFSYSINGATPQTVNWTGNADFNQAISFPLGDLNYTLQNTNDIEVFVNDVNGSSDQYNNGDTTQASFLEATEFHPFLEFDLVAYTDANLVSWQIINSAGDVIAQNQPYQNGVKSLQYVSIKASDCYKLKFKQSTSDAKFSGVFLLKDGNGNEIFKSIYKEKDIEKSFTVDANFLSTQEKLSNQDITVYPNPSKDRFTILADVSTTATLTDMMGKKLQTITLKKGEKYSVENLNSGVYFLTVENITKKVIVH